jgi:hypothetical protein
MQDEFLTLTKTLTIPLLSADDIDALNRLQKQWENWSQRERQHDTRRRRAAGCVQRVPRQPERRG